MGDSDPTANPNVAGTAGSRTAETVYFALKPRVDYRKGNAYADAAKLVGRVTMVGFGLVVAVVATGFYFLAGVRAGTSWGFIVIMCMVALPLVIWRGLSSWRFRWRHGSRLPLVPPEGCRLSCIGAPEQLAEYGEWADVPFEPALFFGKFALRGRGWPRWLSIGVAGLALLVFLGFGWRFIGGGVFGQVYLGFIFALGVAETATALLWPTYVRLVPGRLDVLGYGPLSKKPVFVDRYDLRQATIMADLRKSFVSIIRQHGQHTRRLEFGIALMSERRKFVYMLFLAAMSSYEPGPVRGDELVS